MSANEYLNYLIQSRANSSFYSQNEEIAYTKVCGWINEWKQSFNGGSISAYSWQQNYLSIATQKSGSRAKGTSLKGKSDIDIFVSITDPSNNNTTKDYYDSLHRFLKSKMGDNELRRQNVSIGLSYAGCDIDVTPGKKINHATHNYQNSQDHNIYSRKKDGLVLTNIEKHISLVRNSGLQKEIMLIKMWRNCHGLELPSIYIEIFATEVFKNQQKGDLASNVWELIRVLRDTIQTRRIFDPANSSNIISDTLTNAEKQEIAKTAQSSLTQPYWESIIW